MPYNVERVADVLPLLDAELETMRKDTNRAQLKDIDPDTAFELGFEMAIHRLRSVHGDDPTVIRLVTLAVPEPVSE